MLSGGRKKAARRKKAMEDDGEMGKENISREVKRDLYERLVIPIVVYN